MGRGATVPQSRIIINVTAVEEKRPLTAMGRFFHEAVAVEPATGHVYETEDRGRPASSAGKGRARKGSPRRAYRINVRGEQSDDLWAGFELASLRLSERFE